MKRRNFLAFLGFAPAAPEIAKALEQVKPAADRNPIFKGGAGKWNLPAARRRLGARLRYVDGRYSRHVPCEFAVDAGGAYNISRIVFAAEREFRAVDRVEIFDVANGVPIMYDTFGTPLCLSAGNNVCIEPGMFRARLVS
jgi:hypothetical protein